MYKAMFGMGVLSLFCVGLGVGVRADGTAADKGAVAAEKPEPGRSVAGNVVVESGLADESTVFTLKLRNAGSECADVSGFNVSATGAGRLELLRGSFDLAPGDVGLIITSPDVDPDDAPRRLYANLYRAVDPDGPPMTLTIDEFALVDASGRVLQDGGSTAMDVAVKCCKDGAPWCWSPVGKSACCDPGGLGDCFSSPGFCIAGIGCPQCGNNDCP